MNRKERIRSRARELLNDTQFRAWFLVKYHGMPKRKAARQLCLARSTLEGRLESANRILIGDDEFMALQLEEMAYGSLDINDGYASPGLVVQTEHAGQAGGAGGAESLGRVDRGRVGGAEAA